MILRSTMAFTIWQNFKLDDWKCGGRDAHSWNSTCLYARVVWTVMLDALLPSPSAGYTSTRIGGISWDVGVGCQKKLRDAAATAADDVESGLNELLAGFGNHERRYLVPLGWNRSPGALMFNLLAPT